MAPMNPDATLGWLGAGLLSLAIGFLFGFVLEQAGFGNARKLAAQFYFYDMTVLKVMFTAIVVAMVLLSLSAGLGLVEMDRIWINPTYLWPGVLGGFLLGVGFILGGYCPGTSLVAMITLKLDGLFFVLGCLLGLTLFGEIAGYVASFWHHAGFYGVVTLPELLGVDPAWVVLAVTLMAVGVFGVVEIVERRLADRPRPASLPSLPKETEKGAAGADRKGSSPSGLHWEGVGVLVRRRLELAVAGLLVALAMAGVVLGRPTVDDKLAWLGPELDKQLDGRQFHIDPGELYDLINNRHIRLALIDVRSEADFNLFHLADARRLPPDALDAPWVASLPFDTVKVVMSNDEADANEAWKRFRARGIANVYILAGGINGWLDVYGHTMPDLVPADASGPDQLRYRFTAALGSAHPAAKPDPKYAPPRAYEPKVKLSSPKPRMSGGCG